MYDIKLQLVAGSTTTADFTGPNPPGKDQGDHHKTIAEVSNAPQEAVDIVLLEGDAINAASRQLMDVLERVGIPKDRVLAGLSVIYGEDVTDAEYIGLQVRVYDHD